MSTGQISALGGRVILKRYRGSLYRAMSSLFPGLCCSWRSEFPFPISQWINFHRYSMETRMVSKYASQTLQEVLASAR